MIGLETVVIGAGQAGLATSYCLSERGCEHLVLERSKVADAWRSRRWDSFTLIGPNWSCTLPGAPYEGSDPDGYMGKDDLVSFFDRYARMAHVPVREGVEARRLWRDEAVGRYMIEVGDGVIGAKNVVVATGPYQRPKVPREAAGLDGVFQLHAVDYRNASQLPDGAVLVVGSGQTGCQIAEDLREAGRDVTLSTSDVGWFPRRYRGRDNVLWRSQMGWFEHSVDILASKKDRMSAPPIQTGRAGGHDLNLRTLAAMGVTLAGRFIGAEGRHVRFSDDLDGNLARADAMARKLIAEIDAFIRERGISAPADETDFFRSAPIARAEGDVDLRRSGISTVLWATGYEFDYGWVDLPVFDEYGYPTQRQGVTAFPGLYFVGLHWMHTRGSGLIFGVGRDAEHVAGQLAQPRR
ncbi:MAG TPA: NAD(P)-binding domain-containing protein [Candidatus Polarisedimenticolaceae bacterium]|nr:NAD(P)-binding domain-containing protein [Candidatus Polarisedimenticolaceae bacterium]